MKPTHKSRVLNRHSSLFSLSVASAVRHGFSFKKERKETVWPYRVPLPSCLVQAIFDELKEKGLLGVSCDETSLVQCFTDSSVTPLRSLDLRGIGRLRLDILVQLIKSQEKHLVKLFMSRFWNISTFISRMHSVGLEFPCLVHLELGEVTRVDDLRFFLDASPNLLSLSLIWCPDAAQGSKANILNLIEVSKSHIKHIDVTLKSGLFSQHLQNDDLSVNDNRSVADLAQQHKCGQLESLGLRLLVNRNQFYDARKFSGLQLLDISGDLPDYMVQSYWATAAKHSPQLHPEDLYAVLRELPNLRSLDISFTLLTSRSQILNSCVGGASVVSDIPALRGLQKPLEFLGIYSCPGGPFKVIPANRVASRQCPEHLATACDYYRFRPTVLASVVKDIRISFRRDRGLLLTACETVFTAVQTDMRIVARDLTHLMIALTDVIGMLDPMPVFPDSYASCLIAQLTNFQRLNVESLLFIGLVLRYFSVESIFSNYEYAAKALLGVLNLDMFAGSLEIYLSILHGITISADIDREAWFVRQGALVPLFELIKKLLEQDDDEETDDRRLSMEHTWNILHQLAGGIFSYPEQFLQHNGIELAFACCQKYSECQETILAITSVVEFMSVDSSIRTALRKQTYIDWLVASLDSPSPNINYNCVYILENLKEDPNLWKQLQPDLETLTRLLNECMERFDAAVKASIGK